MTVLPERFAVYAAHGLTWEPFREGIEIKQLHQSPNGSSSALLRYQPNAQVPKHRHPGHEHIFVLEGSQQDEHGHYSAGELVINLPGSVHSVSSPNGCVVYIYWEQGVEFIL